MKTQLLFAAGLALAGVLSASHAGEPTRNHRGDEPQKKVYIVTSAKTHAGISDVVTSLGKRRDSLGTDLVVAELPASRLSEISDFVHQRELRCGGFFAFDSREDAEAFIASDRSAKATSAKAVIGYSIDNGTTVNGWLPQVTESKIYASINQLASYTNRYYTSATGKSSAEQIRTNWQNLIGSRTDASTELFTACTDCSTQPSVILTINGNELASEIVVLGAHLDSINVSSSGNSQVAPGADDDASGIATLTEVIRVALASGWKPKRTIKFMGYAAEEVGLRGSKAIANSFQSAGKNVVGVLQLDMTNYKSGSVPDMQLITDYSSTELKTFFTSLFDTYLQPLGYTRSTYTCGYGCSDHASWTAAGYPAAMFFEAGDSAGYNPKIHSANDTLANMGESAANSVKFAKFGLAFLGEVGKTNGAAGGAPTASFSVVTSGLTATFTDASTDSDGTIASRAWNFGDSSSSTVTSPSHTYAAAGTYSVTLTVTDNSGKTGSTTKSVTVSSGTGTVLTKGVALTGLSAVAGASTVYTMTVPPGATNLSFTTSGGSGDVDLYVKAGAAPTDTVYDCRPYKSGNAETCSFPTPTAGVYYVRLKAYSAYSGLSLVGDYQTGGGSTGQFINNGSFESGAVNWTGTSGAITNGTSRTPRTGSWYAWLSGNGTTSTETLQQTVSIPSGLAGAQLSFWIKIDTAETTTTSQYDKLTVQLTNTAGTVLTTLGTLSNLNKSSGYVQKTYNLTSYVGQTVVVKFTGTEDSSLQTSFVTDDVVLSPL